MRNLTLLIILVFSSVVAQAGALVLNAAIPGRYDEGNRTPEQQSAIIKLVDIYKKSGEYSMGMLGYVQYPDEKWYSLNGYLSIQGANVTAQQYLGSWHLTRWPYQSVLSGERAAAGDYIEDYSSKAGQMNWSIDNPANLKIGDQVVMESYWSFIDTDQEYGCLSSTPLRYGNIGNGDQSLVLTLQKGRFVVFSPILGKPVFEFNFVNADELRTDAQPRLSSATLPDDEFSMLEYIYKQLAGQAPQWVAASGGDQDVMRIYPAWRSFAKLYEGDVNGDGSHDLLVWRKLYSSLPNSDARNGFELTAQNFAAYKNSAEGYQIQEISLSVIQSWLAEKNLTWQSGYPSKSECEGQEGQLIPEMHDPLLNDPDVLH